MTTKSSFKIVHVFIFQWLVVHGPISESRKYWPPSKQTECSLYPCEEFDVVESVRVTEGVVANDVVVPAGASYEHSPGVQNAFDRGDSIGEGLNCPKHRLKTQPQENEPCTKMTIP